MRTQNFANSKFSVFQITCDGEKFAIVRRGDFFTVAYFFDRLGASEHKICRNSAEYAVKLNDIGIFDRIEEKFFRIAAPPGNFGNGDVAERFISTLPCGIEFFNRAVFVCQIAMVSVFHRRAVIAEILDRPSGPLH